MLLRVIQSIQQIINITPSYSPLPLSSPLLVPAAQAHAHQAPCQAYLPGAAGTMVVERTTVVTSVSILVLISRSVVVTTSVSKLVLMSVSVLISVVVVVVVDTATSVSVVVRVSVSVVVSVAVTVTVLMFVAKMVTVCWSRVTVVLPKYWVTVLAAQLELEVRIGEMGAVAELVVFVYGVVMRLVEFMLVVRLL